MEQGTLRNVNNYLNTNIYSYLETSGGQSTNLYLYEVHFFNTGVNQTSVAAQEYHFPALVSNTCCSIKTEGGRWGIGESFMFSGERKNV